MHTFHEKFLLKFKLPMSSIIGNIIIRNVLYSNLNNNYKVHAWENKKAWDKIICSLQTPVAKCFRFNPHFRQTVKYILILFSIASFKLEDSALDSIISHIWLASEQDQCTHDPHIGQDRIPLQTWRHIIGILQYLL